MKRLLTLLFLLPLFIRAQNKPLVIEGAAPNLYLLHTVAPKENYYSIGRIYNISPKEVAPLNNLVLENGLSLGQIIKIPLASSNFTQTSTASADEVLVPLYHTVQGKEGLYRVSVNYNKVPVETLKEWNHLAKDAVSNGTRLIVGYLKVKKDLSPLAGMATSVPATATAAVKTPAENTEKAVAKETAKTEEPKVEIPRPAPVTKEPVTEKPALKEIEKVAGETVPEPPVKKEEPMKKEEPVKKNEPEKKVARTGKKGFNGGIFKADYEKQTQDKDISGETGEGATFKSTSGWEDGKYYCLHNSSAPGTIVKITNYVTGKTIYAKVLDLIPDIKQNTGLMIRVSNAAAEELGVTDTAKFTCSLSYSK